MATIKEYSVWPFPCSSANEVPVYHAVICMMAGVGVFPF
jgi:hypothetical protein